MGRGLKCTSCGFGTYVGRDIYVITAEGGRDVLPIPSSETYAAVKLGLASNFKEAMDIMRIDTKGKPRFWWSTERVRKWERACSFQVELRKRTGYLTWFVCLRCLEHTQIDREKDVHSCGKCGSTEIVSEPKQCPRCKIGHLKTEIMY